MTGSAQIIRGNALDLPLADASVDLIVTSPPYFGLRSYQDAGEHYGGQIGAEATPAEFVDALIQATREMVRVLKPSGSIWVNLGDKYSGAGRGNNKSDALNNTAEMMASRLGHSNKRQHVGLETAPAKSLIGIPWRYALRCIDDLGLILRAEVIWAKPNGLPESVTDRVRRSHETWFHFTREPRYFSAVDEIRESYDGDGRKRGKSPHTSAGHPNSGGHAGLNLNGNENPLGKLPGSVWRIDDEAGRGTGPDGTGHRGCHCGSDRPQPDRVGGDGRSGASGVPEGDPQEVGQSVWSVPTQPLQVPPELGVDHFAAFPMEWPRRIIQGWSPAGVCSACGEGRRTVSSVLRAAPSMSKRRASDRGYVGAAQGDNREPGVFSITGYACACPSPSAPTVPAVVLDPFGGTGTTALVAKALGRHGISVDMSADYCRLAEWRTTDRGQLAAAMQVEKPEPVHPDQLDLFGGVA
jgi:DNA modification methylase